MNSDRMRSPTWSLALLPVATIMGLQACRGPQEQTVTSMTIGVLPDQEREALEQIYDPLLGYLQAHVGITFDIDFVSSYEELLQQFEDGEIQLAHFGGVTFLQASHRHGAVPLVMRDVDMRFQTVFLVSTDSSAQDISDMRGKRLGFGAKLSTSGHLMPRYFMSQDGIEPEMYFSEVRFHKTHDKTALSVQHGEVDLGAVNSSIVDQMFSDGRLEQDKVRILATSPPYPDYVWAVQKDVPEGLRTKIRDAFLGLTDNQDDHRLILHNLGAGAFLPAVHRDFRPLREIMSERGLL